MVSTHCLVANAIFARRDLAAKLEMRVARHVTLGKGLLLEVHVLTCAIMDNRGILLLKFAPHAIPTLFLLLVT